MRLMIDMALKGTEWQAYVDRKIILTLKIYYQINWSLTKERSWDIFSKLFFPLLEMLFYDTPRLKLQSNWTIVLRHTHTHTHYQILGNFIQFFFKQRSSSVFPHYKYENRISDFFNVCLFLNLLYWLSPLFLWN